MYKFKPDSKIHTTWESSYNPYSDHNYRFPRDARGLGYGGYFLPPGYFEDKEHDNNPLSTVIAFVIVIGVAFLSMWLT